MTSLDPAYYERCEDGDPNTYEPCEICGEIMPEKIEGDWICDACWKAEHEPRRNEDPDNGPHDWLDRDRPEECA